MDLFHDVGGCLFSERDADDRFDAFEAVLPRYDQAHGGSILRWHDFPESAHRHNGERVHGFVDPQSLYVWPIEGRATLAWHLLRVVQCLECNVFGAGVWLQSLEDGSERHADPRDYHRPRLDATEPIQAFFHLGGFYEVLVGVLAWLVALARNLHSPRLGLKS